MWFEASLELRINLEKSFILPIGSFVNIEILVMELGCKVEVLPFFLFRAPFRCSACVCGGVGGGDTRLRKRLLCGGWWDKKC